MNDEVRPAQNSDVVAAGTDRTAYVVDVTDLPYQDQEEAARIVDEGLELLISGGEAMLAADSLIRRGREMLARAQQKQAWKVLGFESWEDLVVDRLKFKQRQVLEPDARRRLAIELVRKDVSLRTIAKSLGVSHPTIIRDLERAERRGEITDGEGRRRRRELITEPDSEAGSVVPEQTQRASGRVSPRPDLARSWDNAVADLARATRSLMKYREDDRYSRRMADLRMKTLSDLQRAQGVLNLILADFEFNGQATEAPSS